MPVWVDQTEGKEESTHERNREKGGGHVFPAFQQGQAMGIYTFGFGAVGTNTLWLRASRNVRKIRERVVIIEPATSPLSNVRKERLGVQIGGKRRCCIQGRKVKVYLVFMLGPLAR